jgi:hypothetical protein
VHFNNFNRTDPIKTQQVHHTNINRVLAHASFRYCCLRNGVQFNICYETVMKDKLSHRLLIAVGKLLFIIWLKMLSLKFIFVKIRYLNKHNIFYKNIYKSLQCVNKYTGQIFVSLEMILDLTIILRLPEILVESF